MGGEVTSVLIVDDHPLLREGRGRGAGGRSRHRRRRRGSRRRRGRGGLFGPRCIPTSC
ncbi:hypothetical protein ACRAWD_30105 [Caulobacter segnis]